MFRLSYEKRPLVENSQRVSASICVRNFLFELDSKAIGRTFNLNNEEDIKNLLQRIEIGTTFNLKQEKGEEEEFTKPNSVRMTYTKSNLGKGFVFWFICNICGRRVKYLYFPPSSQVLACRICHRLAYENQNENKRLRILSRLLDLHSTP